MTTDLITLAKNLEPRTPFNPGRLMNSEPAIDVSEFYITTDYQEHEDGLVPVYSKAVALTERGIVIITRTPLYLQPGRFESISTQIETLPFAHVLRVQRNYMSQFVSNGQLENHSRLVVQFTAGSGIPDWVPPAPTKYDSHDAHEEFCAALLKRLG